MRWFQWPLWGGGFLLQGLVLSALLKGRFRKFPLVFAYTLSLFFTTVVEVAAAVEQGASSLRSYYWVGELVRQTLLLGVVVSLFRYAIPVGPSRAALARLVVLLASVYWAGTFYLGYDQRIGVWMTSAVRNVSFGSAVLNVFLFTLFVSRRPRQSVPLMVSAGYGVQMAGEAIGQSARQLWPWFGPPGSPATRIWVDASNLFIVLTHFACLYVWWLAFRRREEN